MDYPGTKITRRIRIIIMCTLITSFFVISPIVLLYTAGYRYDWQKHVIQQTGVISIDIKPTDSQVFLNNIKIDEAIPIRLSNRASGVYGLKIQRAGYYDWTKEINVESKKTTYVKDITLFKQSLPIRILEEIESANIQNFYTSRTGKFLIISTKKDLVHELYLYNTETEKLSQIIREENDGNITVDWSPFGDYALIKTDKNTGSVIEIFNPDNPELSENYSFSNKIQDYQWPDSQYSATIFISQNKTIWKLNNGNKENLSTVTSSIWYIDNQNNIWSLGDKQLIKNNNEIYNFPETEIDKIIYLGNSQILIKKGDKILSGHFDNTNLIVDYDININNLTPYPGNNGWLVWTPWELWSVQNNGNHELHTRSSEMIKNISPTASDDTILVLFETRLVGFNSRYFTIHELLKNTDIYNIGNNIKKRQIYFFGKVANITGIYQMDY